MLNEEELHTGRTIDAIYVIDGEQRIVEWSDAAAAILGIPHKQALGQPCFKVIRGRGPFGRSACQPCCDAFRSLQQGHVRAVCSLLLDKAPGLVQRLRCELFALPRLPGGALVRLQERIEAPMKTKDLAHSRSLPSDHSPGRGIIGDLAVLANLSTTLSFFSLANFEENLGYALDILREAVGAESAEIFLTERDGAMLLSVYRGPFKNAFCEITRFPVGQGYPGLVLLGREPIVTQSLPSDPRYLRTTVKEKGFQSYICMPLVSAGGIVGSLNLAWRRSDAPLDDALRLLVWASSPISTAIENSLYRIREAGANASLESWIVEMDPDRRLREFLRDIIALGNAAGAIMVLYEPGTGAIVKRIQEGKQPKLICLAHGDSKDEQCVALAEARGTALYGSKEHWPTVCQRSPSWPTLTYCLPIIGQGQALGIVQLGYDARSPSPPTQYLRLLYEMAQGAVHLARDFWLRQQSQKLLLATGTEPIVPVPSPFALLTGLPYSITTNQQHQPPEQAPANNYLDIRCLGHFELYREGRQVTLDAFGRRAALTLLKILLLQRGRPLSRDALAEMLWPEVSPDSGARRLYVTVHALRQVLEPEKSGQTWTYICSKADQYYLNPEAPVHTDLSDFEAYIRQGKLQEKNNDVAGAIKAYDVAVALYRGDLFEDEPYAEWCWDERERLRQQYIALVQKLGALYLEQSKPELSVEYYRRALQVDPLREEIHQGLMLSLWKAGYRSDALKQYQLCCDVLHKHLDVEPLTETKKLYELIKQSPA